MGLHRTIKLQQPVTITLSFLDPKDIFKLMQVNKKLRQLLLGNLPTFGTYHDLIMRKVKDLS